MTTKTYPSYKPSGVEWLGDVPEHWEIKKLSFVTSKIGSGKTPSGGASVYQDEGILFIRSQNVYDDGLRLDEVVYISEEIDSEMSWSRVKPNDILLNITGASLGRTCFIPKDIGYANVNQHVCIIRLKEKDFVAFIAYYLKSNIVKSFFDFIQNGSAREGLNFDQISSLKIILPSLSEQQNISTFLDRETGRIDALIEKKQRLIELLKEKRTALISRAVTRGLDPSVKMKPSGITWLGDVPEHWQILSIKRIVSIPVTDGPHETPEILDEGIPFISAESIRNNKIDFDRKRGYISESDHKKYCLKFKPKRNDIFMIKSGATTGNTAIVETDEEFNIWSPLAVIRVSIKIAISWFVLFSLNSNEFQTSVQLFWSFGTQQNIGMNVIENLKIAIPPLPEQQSIATFLDRETAKIDALVKKVEIAIDRLKEYRSALISAAVTGKIDVGEAV